jgi:bifunctional UDP-N-acetylglucosamine pyrophosphorylase/glucosamine-1-phosphate N-acetyltransferase
MNDISAIVLAGGRGTRMNGNKAKVLYKIDGKPLVYWPLVLLKKINPKQIIVVTGHKSKEITDQIVKSGFKVTFAHQEVPLGTGHAVKIALKKVLTDVKNILVLYGDDSSLYKLETIKKVIKDHKEYKAKITLLSLKCNGIMSVGGLDLDSYGNVVGVLSQDELREKAINQTNVLCGLFCFDANWLKSNINKIKKGKLKGEYPLPVLIEMSAKQGYYPVVVSITDRNQWNSVNTKKELGQARRKKTDFK